MKRAECLDYECIGSRISINNSQVIVIVAEVCYNKNSYLSGGKRWLNCIA